MIVCKFCDLDSVTRWSVPLEDERDRVDQCKHSQENEADNHFFSVARGSIMAGGWKRHCGSDLDDSVPAFVTVAALIVETGLGMVVWTLEGESRSSKHR